MKKNWLDFARRLPFAQYIRVIGMHHIDFFKPNDTVGCVFQIVILCEFLLAWYRDDDHREDTHYSYHVIHTENHGPLIIYGPYVMARNVLHSKYILVWLKVMVQKGTIVIH